MPDTTSCVFCGDPLGKTPTRGPARRYCSTTCRVTAARHRRRAGWPADPVKAAAGRAAADARWGEDRPLKVIERY